MNSLENAIVRLLRGTPFYGYHAGTIGWRVADLPCLAVLPAAVQAEPRPDFCPLPRLLHAVQTSACGSRC